MPATACILIYPHSIAARDGNLRLVNGEKTNNYDFGRLEVFRNGFSSNICDNEIFTPDSADVACRILGYDGGTSILNYRDARGALPTFTEQVLVLMID